VKVIFVEHSHFDKICLSYFVTDTKAPTTNLGAKAPTTNYPENGDALTPPGALPLALIIRPFGANRGFEVSPNGTRLRLI
jgi:hypothetical protein